MRVGKSGALQCDHCGEMIQGDPDVFIRGSDECHFCQGTCLDEYFLELYRDHIDKMVKDETKKEIKLIHKTVCPACRKRVRDLL